MAGPFANVVLGLVLYPLFRFATRRNASPALRLFLWLLTAVNLFIGFVSPFCSGVFGVGDFSDAILSLPHHPLLRALELFIGALFCIGIVRFFAASFAGFPESLLRVTGNSSPNPVRECTCFSKLVPYIGARTDIASLPGRAKCLLIP
jgi:hypothetical protein